MKIDSEWAHPGRAFAWAYGGLLIVAGVLVTVVSVGIPPTAPDLAKHYAYIRQIWPELYISFLLFIAAFASLIAIGVVLREFFGRDIRSELIRVISRSRSSGDGVDAVPNWLGPSRCPRQRRHEPSGSEHSRDVVQHLVWRHQLAAARLSTVREPRHALDRTHCPEAAFAARRSGLAEHSASGLLLAGACQPAAG